MAGVAFAYAPWRLNQDGNLHVLSSGGIPLSLFLLVRGYRRRRPGVVLGGWLVAAWQVLLGFTLGLQLIYLLAVLSLVAAGIWVKRRPRLDKGVGAASAAGVVIFALAALVLAQPYMRVLEDHPEARRTERQVEGLSPPLRSYLTAPEGNLLWGKANRSLREGHPIDPEHTLFPGLAVLALAVLGISSNTYPRGWRWGLAAGGAACAALAQGIAHDGVRLPLQPYRLLYHYAPGWDGVRTPGRINTLTSLVLALLAAAGAHALLAGLQRRRSENVQYRPRLLLRSARLQMIAGGAIVGLVLAEGAGFGVSEHGRLIAAPPHPSVPPPPVGQRRAAAPQLHLPLSGPGVYRYVFWSAEGFPRIVNGSGSFEPRYTRRVSKRMRHFPDNPSVRWLRAVGVRTVILHPQAAKGTQWSRTARGSVIGLPLKRVARGGVIIYRVRGG